ncbi:uncharacterized protein LOC119308873 [Triticum dicoccoides]|uniref:uncharacterized protein LOC119308873 n=1 Tax=Triticum dicoccoides TaxID=85692 RepID=UPI001891EA58|nr:uncharacterized protein LOC119308873 [Triticum dicoccoides]
MPPNKLEEFDRLPIDDMSPDAVDELASTMRKGGLSLGLLDPVSNIILNTIALLPRDFRANPSPPHDSKRRRRSKRTAGVVTPRDSWSTTIGLGPTCRRDTWAGVAAASYQALRCFMVSYFGCLSEEQATRYLHWAGADLALAILLVEHDLYAAELELPDPASQRTRAALKYAAVCGWHPAPDILVRLNASPLPRKQLLDVATFLKPTRRKLTVDDVNTLVDLLRYQDSAPLDLQLNLLPGGREVIVYCRNHKPDQGTLEVSKRKSSMDGFDVVSIKVERHGDHFASLWSPKDKRSMISACVAKARKTSQRRGLVESCSDDACEYTECLKMRLHAMIHTLYLKVFTMLPPSRNRLIRDILWAGHCYGPMDPISNIILSSIWHSIVCPLPSADFDIQVYDILDTLSMLRVEVRSFEGLIALVGANSESRSSMQRVMEQLCCKCCDLSDKTHTLQQFAAAAAAAHAALGSFLASLMPDMLINMRRLLTTGTNGVISSESISEIERIIQDIAPPLSPEPPMEEAQLCKEAKETLLGKRCDYNQKKLFIRSWLAKVLKNYAAEHPQEPKYVPSVICGVEATNIESLDSYCYHVNFVAALESGIAENKLFFAELNFLCPEQQPKPNFCCPLPLTYKGRCYYGTGSARKIMFLDSSDYFESNIDITVGGTTSTDRMLDVDFVFDFRRDVQFAKDVRQYYEDQKLSSECDEY